MASGLRAHSPCRENAPCTMCELCGRIENLKVCGRCKKVSYCSKDHQKNDWRRHKKHCLKGKELSGSENPGGRVSGGFSCETNNIEHKVEETNKVQCESARTQPDFVNDCKGLDLSTTKDSSESKVKFAIGHEDEEDSAGNDTWAESEKAQHQHSNNSNMTGPAHGRSCGLVSGGSSNRNGIAHGGVNKNKSNSKRKGKYRNGRKENDPDMTEASAAPCPSQADKTKSLGDYVVKCLNDYGICVVDNFLGEEIGGKILDEVYKLQDSGKFCDGELVSDYKGAAKVRSDRIAWTEKGDPGMDYVSLLIQRLDNLVMSCSHRFGRYNIGGRTKAMVACYPGAGTYYMRHVDNPNEDGRCITSIYYLNKDWDVAKDGGLLRVYPAQLKQVADIEPRFDRMLFFWSDRRNPHEVQPAYKTRYAITVWYFDKDERIRAKQRHQAGDSYVESARHTSPQLVRATSNHMHSTAATSKLLCNKEPPR